MKSLKNFFPVVEQTGSNKRQKLNAASYSTQTESGDSVKSNGGEEGTTEQSTSRSSSPIRKQSASAKNRALTESNTSASSTAPVESPVIESIPALGWAPFDAMEPSWKVRLAPEFSKPYFQRLLKFLDAETKANKTIFPPSDQIFTALNLCPYDKVKVVVIGQDPYHGPGQAHGLAFSVQKGIPPPPSLKNMFTELQNDPAINLPKPTHGNLEHWSTQGVMLLNAVLTVRKAEANSHQKQGWEEFTDAIVRELRKKKSIVYLLWGKPAQKKCTGIDTHNNVIIQSSHPSPLSAFSTNEPFMGSRMFSRCNEALQRLGESPIDWSL